MELAVLHQITATNLQARASGSGDLLENLFQVIHVTLRQAMMMTPLAFILQCIILAFVFFLFLYRYAKSNKFIVPWNLPIVGILPELLLNFHRLHDKLAEVLERSQGSLLIKGAWLAQKDVFLTSDPANVHHIMTTNFLKYPKGPEWRERFDIFGNDGIFNSDFEVWKHHRKVARSLFSHQKFQQLVAKIIPEITEKGLVPVLEHVAESDMVVDLQDLLNRHTFDFACIITTGYNPKFLSVGLPEISFLKAIEDACEAIFVRYVLPESFWKLQRWMGIGKEKKLRDACKTLDQFWEECMSIKREEPSKGMTSRGDADEESFINLLDCYLTGHEVTGPTPSEKVIRDNVIGLILAAEGTSSITLSWFFWQLSKNPLIEQKIRDELATNLPQKEVKTGLPFNLEDLNKLVYLHAALCETLRLFPPIPFQIRNTMQRDTLPSGHHITEKTNVLISMYAIGRMRSVWGEDCNEFKPERWITQSNHGAGIKHEPPQKFFAFNAGPRMCLGKDIAFNLMKIIAATIIQNYDVQVLESLHHPVTPSNLSISFHIKHGLMARLKKRHT